MRFHGQADRLEILVPEAGDGLADGGPFTPRDYCVNADEH